MLDYYKISHPEDGPDSSYGELPQTGTGTAFITLLTHGMINSEDMRLPWKLWVLASVCGHQSCPLPLGPPSEVSSREEPPSTVGPSASMIEPTPNRRKAYFSVSNYDRETASQKHQDAKRETLTTQPEGSPEVRTSVGTTMPSTSPMRITPSSRPTMTTMDAIPSTSPTSRAPLVETI